jgi:hypothetical protein
LLWARTFLKGSCGVVIIDRKVYGEVDDIVDTLARVIERVSITFESDDGR